MKIISPQESEQNEPAKMPCTKSDFVSPHVLEKQHKEPADAAINGLCLTNQQDETGAMHSGSENGPKSDSSGNTAVLSTNGQVKADKDPTDLKEDVKIHVDKSEINSKMKEDVIIHVKPDNETEILKECKNLHTENENGSKELNSKTEDNSMNEKAEKVTENVNIHSENEGNSTEINGKIEEDNMNEKTKEGNSKEINGKIEEDSMNEKTKEGNSKEINGKIEDIDMNEKAENKTDENMHNENEVNCKEANNKREEETSMKENETEDVNMLNESESNTKELSNKMEDDINMNEETKNSNGQEMNSKMEEDVSMDEKAEDETGDVNMHKENEGSRKEVNSKVEDDISMNEETKENSRKDDEVSAEDDKMLLEDEASNSKEKDGISTEDVSMLEDEDVDIKCSDNSTEDVSLCNNHVNSNSKSDEAPTNDINFHDKEINKTVNEVSSEEVSKISENFSGDAKKYEKAGCEEELIQGEKQTFDNTINPLEAKDKSKCNIERISKQNNMHSEEELVDKKMEESKLNEQITVGGELLENGQDYSMGSDDLLHEQSKTNSDMDVHDTSEKGNDADPKPMMDSAEMEDTEMNPEPWKGKESEYKDEKSTNASSSDTNGNRSEKQLNTYTEDSNQSLLSVKSDNSDGQKIAIAEEKIESSGDQITNSTVKVDEAVKNQKITFKDILKLKPSHPSNAQLNTSVECDPIVIDESQMVPETHPPHTQEKEMNGDDKASSPLTSENEIPVASDGAQEQAKKRSLSNVDDTEIQQSKRFRLDSVINKLGEHVGVDPTHIPTVIMDSDDDDEEKLKKLKVKKKEAKQPKAEEKKADPGSSVTLSSKMLRSLIAASLKSFVTAYKLEKSQLMDDRMKKMEAATDLWNETAKHIEKSVNELTVYNKELTKRKAYCAKLKQLSSRTIGVQVQVVMDQASSVSHTQTKPPQNPSTPRTSLGPSVLLNPSMQQQQASKANTPNKSMAQTLAPAVQRQNLTPSRQQMRNSDPRNVQPQQGNRQKAPNFQQNSPQIPNSSVQQRQGVRPPANYMTQQFKGESRPPPPPYNQLVMNLIDLTAEDETSKQTATHPVSKEPAVSNPARRAVSASNGVISPGNQTFQPGVSQINSTAATTGPGNHYQLVNSGTVRPGAMATLVPNSPRTVNSVQAASKLLDNISKTAASSALSALSYSLPPSVHIANLKHPAPLPYETNPAVSSTSVPPPKPSLKISRVAHGIVLSWNMPLLSPNVAPIASYQLFAYQETTSPPVSSLWKKVGDVKALPLPMACTLVQFQEGNKYYFAVRALDSYGRWGEYSDASSIFLYPLSSSDNA